MDQSIPHHRILAVDDEESMLELYRDVFEPQSAKARAGQGQPVVQIETLSQGEAAVEAVRTARAAGRPFALAIIDMSMPPGIDGMETARRVRALDPHIHIAIVSGYGGTAGDHATTGALAPDHVTLLAKPVRLSILRSIADKAMAALTAA
jgi:CheY-like chemotaxis protein